MLIIIHTNDNNNTALIIIIEGFKALFCFSKFPWALKRIPAKFIGN